MNTNELNLKAKAFESLLISIATGNGGEEKEYQELRSTLLNSSVKGLLPEYLLICRSVGQFWQFIKYEYAHYRERRDFIWSSFQKIHNAIENDNTGVAMTSLTQKIEEFNMEYITTEWNKALERKSDDPEAAITSARTLLETTCKHILDSIGETYDHEIELPKLYKLTASNLNLSPDQHTEDIFKQILGGCCSIVIGLGSMRNKLSDSHGKTMKYVRPSARHAALAVNLSGAMTTFLLETYNNKFK